MTVSKKLALTQVIIYSILIVGIIWYFVSIWRQVSNSGNPDRLLMFAKGILNVANSLLEGSILILLTLAGFGIGISQIVYKTREGTSGIYLAAGICAIFSLLPILGIVTLILNIIGLIVRNNQD